MFNHTRLWAAALIIAVIVIGGFALSVPRVREVAEPPSGSTASSTPPVVTVSDSFKKGVHTITGMVTAPDACTSVMATASVAGDHILVVVSMPEDTELCLQVPTKVHFSASVTGPAGLPIETSVAP